jgi:hypothetical protein
VLHIIVTGRTPRRSVAALAAGLSFLLLPLAQGAPLPPLVCPAGGPIGSVDLRVISPARGGAEALPLRTINRLEEGDLLLYRPLLRPGEQRKGEVAFVLVPTDKTKTGEKLVILDPKSAAKPQRWSVPWRVSVVAFVYGPSGLNTKKVRTFLSRDDELVAQLADYAEKTAQTEALIAALSSPNSSAASVEAALQGFSSQYGLSVQIDKNMPPNQQALILLRTLNPAIAGYDPISPQGTAQLGPTAGLATSVAALFFGSPVGLAAGGTAMLLELRALAFPRAEFRSSFSQTMPNDGLGLCGRRNPAPPHTKVAYLWASRVPNAGPPQLSIGHANSLPAGAKSPLPVSAAEADWKVADRARHWMLESDRGRFIPIQVQKLGETKTLELDLSPAVEPGRYRLLANWDWDRFQVKGHIDARPLAGFASARLAPASQDLLVGNTGKVPVTVEDADFEFVAKVEIEKVNDKFASPVAVPFVLPAGIRQGVQDHMDIQINTIDLDPGQYKLLITQVDGRAHAVPLKILPAPPRIENLPVVLNQGASQVQFLLKGQRLDLLKRVEVAKGTAELQPRHDGQPGRLLTLRMAPDIDAGTSLAMKAYIEDRTEPLTFSDAVRIVGPRPRIAEVAVSQPPDQDVQLATGELPGGMYLSAMMRVEHLQSNSMVKLGCEQTGGASVTLRLGERSGPSSFQQLAPDQVFLSFDTSPWLNGCLLQAVIANGSEGESDPYRIGRIVRVPMIDSFTITSDDAGGGRFRAILTGQNLETIEKVGWSVDHPEPVTALPLPDSNDAQRQRLEIHVPLPPESHSPLYVWLRTESTARITKVRP